MNDIHRLQEVNRLTFKAKGVLRTLEKCVSKLRSGFLNDHDLYETKKTINRLDCEIRQINLDIEDKLE